MALLGLIVLFIGIADIICSVADLDFFFDSLKISLLVGVFGRNCARILVAILGVISIIIGLVCIIFFN